MVIRPEAATDVSAIDALLRAAFPSDGEARLVMALRNAGKLTLSLVAEAKDEVIGHAAFSPIAFDPDVAEVRAVGLAPLSVSEAFRRQGVGVALVERGLEACRNLPCDAVFVLGELRYYRRFGFRSASDFGIANEYGAGDEFMVAELRPGTFAEAQAIAKYAAEFGLVDS